MKPNATCLEMKRKTNSLRTNFRKELKKISASKRSGIATDEIYEPTSWVFYSLRFSEKYEQPTPLSEVTT